MRVHIRHLKARALEWATFESRPAQLIVALTLYLRAILHLVAGQQYSGWALLMKLHRNALSAELDRRVELRVRSAADDGTLCSLISEIVDRAPLTSPQIQKYVSAPEKLLGPHATVLKAAAETEKGVLLLNYSYIYLPFLKLFDVERIAAKYYLVLEPSWSGTCEESLLAFSRLPTPVFVQCSEPRDIKFLNVLKSSLRPVPTAANWWIDHSIYKPLTDSKKDIDVVMVAAWASFKRHHRFFRTLADLKRRGYKLTATLIGYPSGLALADIVDSAKLYGIADQIEFHEWLSPEEVNRQMNRARVNLVWSRREGSNRAVIEGLFAGVPFIMRRGFNYGHTHSYVNSKTGLLADDDNLGDLLLQTIASHDRYSPRTWALENMTYEHATAILERTIRLEALQRGEQWSRGLAHHVSQLHGNRYVGDASEATFAEDYAFLKGCALPH